MSPSRVYNFFAQRGHEPPSTLHDSTNLTPSLSNLPPSCETPRCRSIRNRSSLHPSHPVLSALHPQGFRTRFALLAAAHRSFGWASPPTKVFSCATWSQCSRIGLSQGHGCTKSSNGLVSCAVPQWCQARPGGVRCGVSHSASRR